MMDQYKGTITMACDIGERNYLDVAVVILTMIILDYEDDMDGRGGSYASVNERGEEYGEVEVDGGGLSGATASDKNACVACCDDHCVPLLYFLDLFLGCFCSCCYYD